jgi:hypothetical protein
MDWRGLWFLRFFDRPCRCWYELCALKSCQTENSRLKNNFVCHLSSMHHCEDILPCAFDSEHTSYTVLVHLCSLCEQAMIYPCQYLYNILVIYPPYIYIYMYISNMYNYSYFHSVLSSYSSMMNHSEFTKNALI